MHTRSHLLGRHFCDVAAEGFPWGEGNEGELGWVGGKNGISKHNPVPHPQSHPQPAQPQALCTPVSSAPKLGTESQDRKRRCPGCSTQRTSIKPRCLSSLRRAPSRPPGAARHDSREPGPHPFACVCAQSCGSGTERRAAFQFPGSGFSPSGLQMRKHLVEDGVQGQWRWGSLDVAPPCAAWGSLKNEAYPRGGHVDTG